MFVITAYEIHGKKKKGVSEAATEEGTMKRKQKLPTGWDEKRVQDVVDHYEKQTDEERLAEIEAARKRRTSR